MTIKRHFLDGGTPAASCMALGQLIDYRRFVTAASCMILLPAQPRLDLVNLIHGQGIGIVWQDGSKFSSLAAANGQAVSPS